MGDVSFKKIALSFVVITSFIFTWWCYRLIFARPTNINHFYLRVFAEYLWQEPEQLTQFGFIENTLVDFHSDELTDVSPAKERDEMEMYEKALRLLNQYEPASLNNKEKLSFDIFHWFLEDKTAEKPFLFHDYIINQYQSAQIDLPAFLINSHQVVNEQSAWNYISRLLAVEKKFNQLIEAQQLRAEKGVIPPRHILQKVLDQTASFTKKPVTESTLLVSFENKLKRIRSIDDEQKTLLKNAAEKALIDVVYPSYQRLETELTSLLEITPNQSGIWTLPNGEAYYEYLLRHYTTTDLSPEEIHQIGLEELEIVKKEINQVQFELGKQDLSFQQFIKQITREYSQVFENTPKGKAKALDYLRNQLAIARKHLSNIVDLDNIPEIHVKQLAEDRQKNAPPVVLSHGSINGKKLPILEFNFKNMDELPKYTLFALLIHEAYPGHHLQHHFQHNLKDVPMFRKVLHFSAYSEGWAMYSEILALENGFADDPVSKIGLLQSRLWRIVRLVVDTGIHKYRWSRQQAIDYMVEQTGLHEDVVTREIDRYIVKPGQACSYIIGMKKYLGLKVATKHQLGDSFDLRQFHHKLLSNGAMPLEILDKNVM